MKTLSTNNNFRFKIYSHIFCDALFVIYPSNFWRDETKTMSDSDLATQIGLELLVSCNAGKKLK